jgi:hypothetical protein
MKTSSPSRFVWFVALGAACLGVLALYGPNAAVSQEAQQPFANSVEQRNEIIAQLKEVNAQLKEQNALLRSGELKVVVTLDKKQ